MSETRPVGNEQTTKCRVRVSDETTAARGVVGGWRRRLLGVGHFSRTPPACCLAGQAVSRAYPGIGCPGVLRPSEAARILDPAVERAWDVWQTERHRRGEIDQQPAYADNPFRPR